MSKNPVRLGKQLTWWEKIDAFAMRYAHILLPLCFIILVILFVLVCFAIVGVSATDSGVTYNQMERII